jgi:hypothetical protein
MTNLQQRYVYYMRYKVYLFPKQKLLRMNEIYKIETISADKI